MNLVRTYLKRLPTLRESQAASFLLGWPRRTQENLPRRKPKLQSAERHNRPPQVA